MKRIKYLLLVILLAATTDLVLTGCDKKSNKSKEDQLVTAKTELLDCTLTDTNVTSTGTNFNYYTSWVPVTFTFPSSGPQIRFEGFSNSFIRPVTANWYIGTTVLADTCSSWADIKSHVTAESSDPGDAPDSVGYSPCNVVGINGIFNSVDYGVGYYGYNGGSHVPTVNYAVVIWKDANNTNVCVQSNPVNATEAYIIRVRNFVVTGSYSSRVNFAYRAL